MQLHELIERAAVKKGTYAKVAEALGVTRQRLAEWKAGTRPCPLHVQAQIAEIAGEDAKEWVWTAICRLLGRVAAAVLLPVALSLAAAGAPDVAGTGSPEPA